jgi:microcystin-dependent protein
MTDINIGAISEALNNKADVDLHNLNNEGKKSIILAGMVMAFAGPTAPTGWLKCDGSAVSRTTYASLFVAIGTTYGAGNGSTTFNLPNLLGRVPFGMDGQYVGQSTNGVLPNITGDFGSVTYLTKYNTNDPQMYANGAMGIVDRAALNNEYSHVTSSQGSNRKVFGYTLNAGRSNSIYAGGWFDGTRVVPASVGMTYYIKY